jgi:hypothetical protein
MRDNVVGTLSTNPQRSSQQQGSGIVKNILEETKRVEILL